MSDPTEAIRRERLAEINADKTGLKLTDLTGPAPAPTPIFHVDSVNASKIAQVLGIFGGDVSTATGRITLSCISGFGFSFVSRLPDRCSCTVLRKSSQYRWRIPN